MNVVREEAAVRDLAKAGLARGRCALDKVISRLRQTRTAPEQPFFGHVSLLSFGDRLDAAATELVLRVWQAWSYETAKTRAFRVALLHPVDPCCVEIVKVIVCLNLPSTCRGGRGVSVAASSQPAGFIL